MSFLSINPSDFVISADTVVAPCWSANAPTLTTIYTGSTTNNNNEFYLSAYQSDSLTAGAEVQFTISYGNKVGSGSLAFNQMVPENTPSKVTYGQYKTLIYGEESVELYGVESDFDFGGSDDIKEIFVLNIDRNRYKEKLLPGSLTLKLTGPSATVFLTDNNEVLTTNNYLDCGRVFNIVSGTAGSIWGGTTLAAATGSYGLFLPDVGLIILNPIALTDTANGGIGLARLRNSNTADRNDKLLHNAIKSGASFTLLSEETIPANYVFVRVPNAEFNYSLNPSMVSGSGELVHSNFIQNPQTYFTTVGLYNNNNELLAVGKVSKPFVKDFTREALIRVKLNW